MVYAGYGNGMLYVIWQPFERRSLIGDKERHERNAYYAAFLGEGFKLFVVQVSRVIAQCAAAVVRADNGVVARSKVSQKPRSLMWDMSTSMPNTFISLPGASKIREASTASTSHPSAANERALRKRYAAHANLIEMGKHVEALSGRRCCFRSSGCRPLARRFGLEYVVGPAGNGNLGC